MRFARSRGKDESDQRKGPGTCERRRHPRYALTRRPTAPAMRRALARGDDPRDSRRRRASTLMPSRLRSSIDMEPMLQKAP
jgi:hypothetical protein